MAGHLIRAVRTFALVTACHLLAVGLCVDAFGQVPGGSLYQVQTQLTPASSKAETVYACNTGAIEFLQRIRNRMIWRWQRPQSYHSAAVMVRVSGGAGSGVIVRVSGNRCIVLTCEHVLEGNNGTATVTFLDGTHSNARVLSSWREYDVAGLLVERPPAWAVGLPLASKNTPVNSPIEVMGFGGPKYGDFRPFVTVNQTSQNSAIELDAPSIPGDSGAGMVWNGGIVGIQFGAIAEMRPVKHFGVPLVYPASSKGNPEVLSQFVTQICSPMGMQPIYCDPQVQIDIQGRNPSQNQMQEFYPPSNWEYQPQVQPQIQPQYPQQPPALNPPVVNQGQVSSNPSAEEIAQAISNSLRECLADLKGEKGEKGDRGERGERGDVGPQGLRGPAGEMSEQQLVALSQSIAEQVYKQVQADVSSQVASQVAVQLQDGSKFVSDKLQANIIAAIKDALPEMILASLPDTEVYMIDGSTREVIDRDTYAPGKPIMLDFQKVLNAVRAQQRTN